MPYHRCTACGLTSYSATAYSSARVCPTCLADLSDDSRLDIVPGVVQDRRFSLAVRPGAAGEARRALRGLALPEITREDLALIASELVTNAVLHAGLSDADQLDVELASMADGVRLSVHDVGGGFTPGSLQEGAALRPGGRGLLIIDALSKAWGVETDAEGCTVWCDLAVEAAAPAGRLEHAAFA